MRTALALVLPLLVACGGGGGGPSIDPAALSVLPATLPDGVPGGFYSVTLLAAGGTGEGSLCARSSRHRRKWFVEGWRRWRGSIV